LELDNPNTKKGNCYLEAIILSATSDNMISTSPLAFRIVSIVGIKRFWSGALFFGRTMGSKHSKKLGHGSVDKMFLARGAF
jgi:hypothetical protein